MQVGARGNAPGRRASKTTHLIVTLTNHISKANDGVREERGVVEVARMVTVVGEHRIHGCCDTAWTKHTASQCSAASIILCIQVKQKANTVKVATTQSTQQMARIR